MKVLLLTFVLLSLILTASAQKKSTDRELEGLKGSVKSVLYDFPHNSPKKRIHWSKQLFDKEGRVVQILYPFNNKKAIFGVIDGFKTIKGSPVKIIKRIDPFAALNSIPLKKGIEINSVLGVVPWEGSKPIEAPENLVSPDTRFDLKYVYEYDSQNRVSTERKYLNNGRLVELSTNKYDENDRVIEKKVKDVYALSQLIYKYNEKGNLIEKTEDRYIPEFDERVKTRIVYSDYKIDAQGNWTQRTSTPYFDDESIGASMTYYRTIVYY